HAQLQRCRCLESVPHDGEGRPSRFCSDFSDAYLRCAGRAEYFLLRGKNSSNVAVGIQLHSRDKSYPVIVTVRYVRPCPAHPHTPCGSNDARHSTTKNPGDLWAR